MNFYTSKSKLSLIHLLLILIIILLLTTSRTIIGVALSLFFGFLVLKTLPDLFTSKQVLSFDNQGIQTSNDRNKRFGVILWEDIIRIQISSFKFNRYLSLTVNNPEKYRNRVIESKGKLYAPLFQDVSPYISLSFDLLSPSLNEAINDIKSHHPDQLKAKTQNTDSLNKIS